MQPQKSSPAWAPKLAIGYWLNRASRLMLRRHDTLLRPHRFSMSQIPVVVALMDGSARSQKDLAERAEVAQPTMAEMLGRMERDGVVRRIADPHDRRGSLISLTAAAMTRLPTMRAALTHTESDALGGLTADEKETLRTLLQRVVTNLESAEATTDEPDEEPLRARRMRSLRD